ncbi:MAG: lysine--tRNA ligase [Candidatus Doudnabacteria bacterium RIFCSPLOWO2_02_FULL_49_13]|uniref:Lysine--tRNA ligase n=1 Tax=Candidatus Doudnabacteria bacterium RIFCSPHIGHO2_12_FULL_48_16 TaxID=1817838 RepID=A0A1F5PIH4_9BACT|nr:MAG: lysine--tRNA ligase [Candidatus Doudnabacteria bacterium RIFCSPHIGHO2_02_FULL_49_24]OGE89367.1 MAG: lysine--tRNA ligase [Candidatus Doudnabacteria bacterium RIFCSPHIGHO2_01_FULL_50_67]OGE89679.1 MAG: lysine--tRNA ligase [Candidatus Doudnabacteria bacterium RIFCSPHIGHO2_12_FULL_48_16]OGE97513.1 MAG: lysine--tRNA ligase [Candidatus Doudnabacteria bacterium RIFCSPLOWO2_01_FULL_49_40]OGF03083.1 MAG: lysine--tRNA ligase [Candidatus Doudnabacteria bacterium RIFCSPLOWO2_02_FULL_49_13]OGF03589
MSEKIEELRSVRIQKLEELKKAGIEPYPIHSERTHTVAEALGFFENQKSTKNQVTLAGRIRSIRTHGKLTFGNLEDASGQIQFMLREDVLGEKFKQFNTFFDMGDFLQVSGNLELSKTGEKTLQAADYKLLSKSIRPIPQNYFGLKDPETKLRKRYLDLVANPQTRELFRKKALFWQTVRKFMIDQGFLEVWTPVLENIAGGADAEPFLTHHNALDRDFYMRISLELPLKRLLVGGYEKVFEIGRLFRNEGIDRDHLQEYDDMEFYWAYSDHEKGMNFVEDLYKEIVSQVAGSMETTYEEHKINWASSWPRIDYFEAFKNETRLDLNAVSDDELLKTAQKLKLKVEKGMGRGRLIDAIYKKTVRPKLIQPCFLVGHPLETSPLAKKDPQNPHRILRFQPIAGGAELGNGFSELNDPLDQRGRFEEQMKMKAAGDKEAHSMDEDYVEALEYGMPPAVGYGMSERVFAVLMNRSIRETVIFPPMKEEEKNAKS